MTVGLEEFRGRQRAVWESGDYAALSPYILDVGERLVERAGVKAGMKVLDVACGTGNAARAAARAGAEVTGIDLAPRLLEAGRAKAENEGLAIDFREGDAEALPFADGEFDVVASTFGHMFAPRHQNVADEMARVCRKGGTIATATWLPDGSVGDVFRASGAYMPPLPEWASPPILWGNEDYVRERFASVAKRFEFERHVNRIEWDSPESFADFFMDRFGPMVTARAMLGERFVDLREEILEIWRRVNESRNGGFVLPQQYLLSVVRM